MSCSEKRRFETDRLAGTIKYALRPAQRLPQRSEPTGFRSHCRSESRRAKKSLTLEQHRSIKDELANYLKVKFGSGTLGTTVDGCAALTALGVNVFSDEGETWLKLGPHGVAGCCSSFVYYVPDIVLPLNRDLAERNWERLGQGTAKIARDSRFRNWVVRITWLL